MTKLSVRSKRMLDNMLPKEVLEEIKLKLNPLQVELKLKPLQIELWKDVRDYEGVYQVSSFGRAKIVKGNKIKKPVLSNRFYYYGFSKRGKKKKFCISKLVLNHFGIVPEGTYHVKYIDGNKFNCNIENLTIYK